VAQKECIDEEKAAYQAIEYHEIFGYSAHIILFYHWLNGMSCMCFANAACVMPLGA